MVRVLSKPTFTFPNIKPVFLARARTNASAGSMITSAVTSRLIPNNLKADAKGHDDTSNDQVDKRVTPGTAETGRNDGHGLVNAETEKESNRDLQSLFYTETLS